MGRRSCAAITTYGKHRQRVVATDAWSSEDDKKQHLFSFSSSFGSSEHLSNINSANNSTCEFHTRRRGRQRNKQVTFNAEKENKPTRRKGDKKSENKKYVIFNEKESSSSSSGSAGADKLEGRRLTRRALKECGNRADATGYSTRSRSTKSFRSREDPYSGTNFSEYDDYSLIVSSSPERGRTEDHQSPISAITSTPFRRPAHMKEVDTEVNDVSIIEAVEESSPEGPPCSPPEYPSQASLFSPSHAREGTHSISTGETTCDSAFSQSEDTQSHRLGKLEESLRNLHVSRRHRKRIMSPQAVEPKHRGKRRVCMDSSSQPLVPRVQLRKLDLQDARLRGSATASSSPPCITTFNSSCSLFSDSDLAASIESTGSDEDNDSIRIEEEDTESDDDDFILVEEDSEEEEGNEEDSTEPYQPGTFVGSLTDIEESDEEEGEEEESETDEAADANSHNRLSGDGNAHSETLYLIGSDVSFDQWEEDASVFTSARTSETSPLLSLGPNASKRGSSGSEEQNVTRYMLAESRNQTPSVDGVEEQQDDSPRSTVSGASSSTSSQRTSDGSSPSASDTSSELGFKELLTPSRRKKKSLVGETPRGKILHLCGQSDLVTFQDCIPPRMMKKCVKIGEGVYGEVFRSTREGQSVALKIIPIEGDFPVNDEPQKTFAEILPEVVISKALSDLRHGERSFSGSYCQVNRVSCVQGAYPSFLLKQWDIFAEKKHSENDRPDVFGESQLFIVFEFADGGSDLESFQFDNPFQARSVLQQVILALAVAEETIEFEHRDLHIGNVLIRETEAESIDCMIDCQPFSIPSQGVQVSIIDFTLSRLRKDGCTVFCDLSTDESLFEGEGDLQFDVYREMRDLNKNQWEAFQPRSNTLWIHYLADKLLHRKRYLSKSRDDREALKGLRGFLGQARDFASALHMAMEGNFLQS